MLNESGLPPPSTGQQTSNTDTMQDTALHTRQQSTFTTMNRHRDSITLILNFLICHIFLASRIIAAADISEIKLPPQNQQINLTALIQDTRVWNAESLYQMEDIQTPKHRQKRSAVRQSNQLLVDMCQSKMEVLTPYHATNSKGALRTIVNSELMQQAIQVETCTREPILGAGKCNSQPDCGCEQKYKWHRLLSLDPKLPARGLFMDWFLFPSNCVCRCKPATTASIFVEKQLTPLQQRPVK